MLRLRINWTGTNSGFSVMHSGDALASAQSAADAVEDWLNALSPYIAAGQAFQVDPEAEEVDPVTGNVTGVASVVTINQTGDFAVNPVPQAAQALVRWRTGQYIAGREIRGRTFIPGMAGSQGNVNGELLPATLAAMQTASTAFLTASGHGIWSPKNGQFELALTASVWPEFAVMRSRRD